MNLPTLSHALVAVLALSISGAGVAGPREDQLAAYAAAAKSANPAFAGRFTWRDATRQRYRDSKGRGKMDDRPGGEVQLQPR